MGNGTFIAICRIIFMNHTGRIDHWNTTGFSCITIAVYSSKILSINIIWINIMDVTLGKGDVHCYLWIKQILALLENKPHFYSLCLNFFTLTCPKAIPRNIFSSPGHRPCELLSWVSVRRPSVRPSVSFSHLNLLQDGRHDST